jgi:hypothetical protein
MIQKIKKFDRTERELQEFLLFCIFTSGRIGKKSSEISRKLDLFLNDKSNKKNIRPFDWIELIASIKSNHGRDYLYLFLVGYGLLSNKRTLKCLREVTRLRKKLKEVTENDLESIHGIGKAIASFFITNTRG